MTSREQVGSSLVRVRRTGGFIGRPVEGELDLAGGDDRAAIAQTLVDRIDLATAKPGQPYPDMFVYAFDLCGVHATVPQHHLTPDLVQLAELVLPDPTR